MAVERRRSARLTPREFTYIQLEQEHAGRVLNLSEEGLSFESFSPLREEELIQFWFAFHGLGQVDGVGKVIWMSDSRKLGGISFLHLSRSSRQKMSEYLVHLGSGSKANTAAEVPPETVSGFQPSQPTEEVRAKQDTLGGRIADAATDEIKRREPSVSVPPLHQAGKEHADAPSAMIPPPMSERSSLIPSSEREADSGRLAATPQNVTPTATKPRKWPASAPAPAAWQSPAEPSLTEGKPALATSSGNGSAEDVQGIKGSESSSGPPLVSETASVWQGDYVEPPHAPSVVPKFEDPSPGTMGMGDADTSTLLTDLVPLKRHLSIQRIQFLRGLFIGACACTLIAVLIVRYAKPWGRAAVSADPFPAAVSADAVSPGDGRTTGSVLSFKETSNGLGAQRKSRKPERSNDAGLSSVREPGKQSAIASSTTPSSSGESTIATPASTAPPASGANVERKIDKPSFTDASIGSSSAQGHSGTNSVSPAPSIDSASTSPSSPPTSPVATDPIGGDARTAKLIRSVAPVYPALAKNMHVSGDVVIEADVTTSGKLSHIHVLSGPPVLLAAAVHAVEQWEYQPAMLNGKVTASRVTVTIKFRAD
jgi:TonB family protein